ncbi:hypothetical protein FVEN_g12632 [Fusarium venenatum]|uniref:Uncharacterized protein n=1 Tax=Fusarium venenatum TaxID=56646 RepID=A0A2L2T5U5_9HYPO|nr:uncharacterized protein FVRRES_07539 [Fusarium venenatum]KAG8362053.1 hypothetical protein FVEN_g12632 [Fusarium venenatum]CEI63103.1 unnamed protein product [Fusarium venenatum]
MAHQQVSFTTIQWLWTAILFPVMTFVFYKGFYNEPQAGQKVAQKAQ